MPQKGWQNGSFISAQLYDYAVIFQGKALFPGALAGTHE